MKLFTTCIVCGQLLLTAAERDVVHPNCDPRGPEVPQHHPVAMAPYLDKLVAQYLDAALAEDEKEAARLEALIAELDKAPPRLLDAALLYASWGWKVFPLHPTLKTPITKHGFKDASADPVQVRQWWTTWSMANIGLPTGERFDAIDVDVPKGIFVWPSLRDSDAMPEVHGLVSTASGGVHAYVLPSAGGNLAGMLTGIDYRGVGGYVVAPPSIRADRRRWQWTVKPSPVLTQAVHA